MLKTMQDAERDAIFAVADLMAAAAKTAPKGQRYDCDRDRIRRTKGSIKRQADRARHKV